MGLITYTSISYSSSSEIKIENENENNIFMEHLLSDLFISVFEALHFEISSLSSLFTFCFFVGNFYFFHIKYVYTNDIRKFRKNDPNGIQAPDTAKRHPKEA